MSEQTTALAELLRETGAAAQAHALNQENDARYNLNRILAQRYIETLKIRCMQTAQTGQRTMMVCEFAEPPGLGYFLESVRNGSEISNVCGDLGWVKMVFDHARSEGLVPALQRLGDEGATSYAIMVSW